MASSLFSTQNTTDVFQKFSQLEKVLRNKNPDQILQKLVSSGMVQQEQIEQAKALIKTKTPKQAIQQIIGNSNVPAEVINKFEHIIRLL